MHKTRLISLLAFAPVLIASCTLSENAEASGIFKGKCHSELEVDPDWCTGTDLQNISSKFHWLILIYMHCLYHVRIYGDPLKNKTKQYQ